MKRVALTTAAAMAAVVLMLIWRSPAKPAAPAVPSTATRATDPAQPGGKVEFPFAPRDPLAGRSLTDLTLAMRAGVLAGTEPDGDWICDAGGGLRADDRVRARMDLYTNQLGQFSAEEIALVLSDEAATRCGPLAGRQALAVWKTYLDSALGADGGAAGREPTSLRDALAAAVAHRRRVMGVEWAAAFFGDEEALLAARLNGAPAPLPAPQALPDAPSREAELQAQWAAWDARIESVRGEAERIRRDASLGESERAQRLNELLESRFDPAERARARALVGLG